MIPKVVIPAAGRGTRMKNLSQDRPKHLIEVNGRPFLYHLLTNLKKAGYQEFVIVCGYHADQMKMFAVEFASEFNLTLVNQFEILGEEKYGTACAVEVVEDIIGDHNFVVLYGDNLYSPKDLALLKDSDDDYNYLVGKETANWQGYGVLLYENDLLKQIVEKPKEFVSDIINLGFYKFTSEIFAAIRQIEKSPRGEFELTDAINLLAKQNKVKVKVLNDYWLDFGKPEDIVVVGKHLENN